MAQFFGLLWKGNKKHACETSELKNRNLSKSKRFKNVSDWIWIKFKVIL